MSSHIPDGVELQQVWLVEAQYTADAAERRAPVRGEHLARVAAMREAGTFIEAGAYTDKLSSSVILMHAESEEAALAIAREDVYVRAGVWGQISVRPFGRVVTGGG